jgi:hypothetical protein
MGWWAVGSACRSGRIGRIPFGCPAGGGISGALPGTADSVPALARAAGRVGASEPPLGDTPGADRPIASRPPGDAGAGGTSGAPAKEVPVAGDDGVNGMDLSAERSTPSAGPMTGPAASGGAAAGLGGGAGATTALRAAALISAIERVSGGRSSLISCNFFRSKSGCSASTAAAGGAGTACPSAAFSAGSLPVRKCARILSARSSSSALEWDFLS